MSMNLDKVVLGKNHSDFLKNTRQLKSMLGATAKSITVKIDQAELKDLKDSGYALCFAKKVGDKDYNVIWKSMNKYLENNKFTWTPVYQISGTNTFEDSIKVETTTNTQDIGLGEKTTIDEYGHLSDPVTGGNENSINVKNEYDKIHVVISQSSVNDKGNMETTPIYVSKEKVILGDSCYEPVEKVLIWFQANAETATMFSEMRSNAIEINLTGKSSDAVLYKDGKWSRI